MTLLRHALHNAHDSGRGMASPGQYDGRFFDASVRSMAHCRVPARRGLGRVRVHQKGERVRRLHDVHFSPCATGYSTGYSLTFTYGGSHGTTTATSTDGPLGWPCYSTQWTCSASKFVSGSRKAGLATQARSLRHVSPASSRNGYASAARHGLPAQRRQAHTPQFAR